MQLTIAKGLGTKEGAGYPVEQWLGKGIFWFIFLFFVVGALEVLGFTQLAAPINTLLTTITSWLPALFAAAILAFIAHIVGTVLRRLVVGVMDRRDVDKRLAESSGSNATVGKPLVSRSIIWFGCFSSPRFWAHSACRACSFPSRT